MSLVVCKGKRKRRYDCERYQRKCSSQTNNEVETVKTQNEIDFKRSTISYLQVSLKK